MTDQSVTTDFDSIVTDRAYIEGPITPQTKSVQGKSSSYDVKYLTVWYKLFLTS